MSSNGRINPGDSERLPIASDVTATETTLLVRQCSSKAQTDSGYPDGGWKAWSVVLGSFLALFSGLAMMNSIGAYQAWIATHQLDDESVSRIGWIFSFHSAFTFFTTLFIGPIFDANGPRKLSLVGVILVTTMYAVLGFCRTYWQFFFCIGAVGGLGASLLFTCAVSTIQHWFMECRSLATAWALSGGSLGGIIFPLILGHLLPQLGFAWTTRLIALIILSCGLSAFLLLESRFTRVGHKSYWPDLSILSRPYVGVMAIALLSLELGTYIPITYVASYALAYGHNPVAAFRLLTYLNIGSLAGRWLPAFIGGRVDPLKLQILATALGVFSIFGIWIPAGASLAMVTTFVLVFGLASGSTITLSPLCVGKICKVEEYGRYFSTIYMISSIGYVSILPLSLEGHIRGRSPFDLG